MQTQKFDAYVHTITCTHCNQQQDVHIRAFRGGSIAVPDQMFRCVKCGEIFYDPNVPPIYAGPFLPGTGPAPGIA
jgi:hypothetical protein